MSTWTHSKITRDLSERDSIEPPEGLLDKIKSDIPPDLGSRLPAVAHREAEVVPIHRRRHWLLAASLILTISGGLFATVVLMRQVHSPQEFAEEEAIEARQKQESAAAPLAEDQPVLSDAEQKQLKALGYAAAGPAPETRQRAQNQPSAPPAPPTEPRTASESLGKRRADQVPKEKDGQWSVDGVIITDMAAAEPSPGRFEEVDVKAEAPMLDERRISTGATVSQSELEAIPTARDPWAVLQTTPGVLTDRINVGGNENGQQSQYVGPGSKGDQEVWSVDGVVITDMAALGSSPAYYDFDSFEEMQVTTGGSDSTIATGGIVLNMVTKRGTNPVAPARAAGGVVGGVPGGVVGTAGRRDAPASAPLCAGANEAPSQDMMFRTAVAHEFVKTAEDRLSTFGLDVDTASYTMARRYLRDGNLPPREAIRVEEFVNYFSYGDPPPARGDFALKAEGAASIFTQEPNTYLLRFNLRAREVKAEHRKPAVLTFVVDVSGSMDQGNRLGLVKQSLGLLLDQLRKDDKVGLVVYGDQARVLLEPTSDRELIRQAVQQLVPNGSTNAEAGIALGYDVAGRSFRRGAINRILLCSDGVANVGATGPEAILARIQREAKQGIELTTLGFGMGNYSDVLMEQLADKGNGRYSYLDDLDEARRVLVEELTGTLQTIAEDAKVQVEFFPAAVTRWRLIGYENRDIADEKFRDNTVDAGEIGAGHSVTALYEVQLTPEAAGSAGKPAGKIASLHLRYRVPVTGELRETIHDLRASELVADWKDASPGFRLASLVVEFAETLRGSSHAGDLQKILRRAQRVVGEMADRPRVADVADFARLVEAAARIKEAAEKK